MAVAISSLPSIRCSNQTWIYTSKLEIYSMASTQLQTNIRHSSVWLWGRAKVPINSKSGSQAAVDRGKCTFGKLYSEAVLWEVHSCWVSTSFSNSYGWFRTFQFKFLNPHTSQKHWMGFPHRSRAQSYSTRVLPNPNTRHNISDCSCNMHLYLKVQYGHYLVETFHRPKCQLFRI